MTMQDNFCKEALRMGTLRGFRFFRCYLRGREELLVTVANHPPVVSTFLSSVNPSNNDNNSNNSTNNSSSNILLTKAIHGSSNNASHDAQNNNNNNTIPSPVAHFDRVKALPPASPCAKEKTRDAMNCSVSVDTDFLIGGYARYNVPYVWLRSNHSRFKVSGDDRDLPLQLNTTHEFSNKSCRLWDIISELVDMNVRPPPRNPFEIDRDGMDSVPQEDRALNYGAMAYFLMEQHAAKPDIARFIADDLAWCIEKHFGSIPKFLDIGNGSSRGNGNMNNNAAGNNIESSGAKNEQQKRLVRLQGAPADGDGGMGPVRTISSSALDSASDSNLTPQLRPIDSDVGNAPPAY